MNTYTVTEKQNKNSRREGTEIKAKDLTSAKKTASRMHLFHGTILEISCEGVVVARKEGKKWT